jgi:Ca2+-binding RTX toxin-like protein
MAIINGTELDDDLSSSTAGDVILGLGGNDVLAANADNITLDGGSGDDQLFSFVDGATLIGGSGSDLLIGLGTNDTALYASDPAGVVVDLPNSSAIDGTGGIDTLVGIENVTGSAFNDSLTGDDLANALQGGAGNDTLTGNAGADVFNYSFTPTSGEGTSSTFTDWLSEKYGRDFGDELPDYVPAHHDKHGKDDGHHSKYGDHDHHGHGGDHGHHAPNSGLTEKFFETNYKEWLNEVVVADLLDQGFVLDANGNGTIKIDINEDCRNGTPRIEGLSKDQLAEMFSDRDSVILNDHCKTEKAWYSNSFTSGNGTDTVASADGVDKIVDFSFGVDKLDFSGITKDQFLASFAVAEVGGTDTVITIADNAEWSLTLVGVSGHDLQAFADNIFA